MKKSPWLNREIYLHTATYNGDLDDLECASTVLAPIAWYCGTAIYVTHEVGTLTPNPWGLYNMLGNVRELCLDCNHGSPGAIDPWVDCYSHVGRAGAWHSNADSIRAAARYAIPRSARNYHLGFRPVRTLP